MGRVNRERQLRKTAAELTLASLTLRQLPEESDDAESDPPSGLEPAKADISYILNPEPTPPVNEVPKALRRLQAYTSTISPLSLPSNTGHQNQTLSSILSHLPASLSDPLTSDPKPYSYTTIESNLASASRAREIAQLTARERQKMARRQAHERRKEEALRQNQRREEERRLIPGVRVETGDSMPALPFRGGVRSSPVPGVPEVSAGGSSVNATRVVATQPQPGVFGARKKPKKKERLKGF